MTKEELKEIRYLDHLIDSKQKEIDLLRQRLRCLRAVDYSKDKIQSQSVNDSEERIIRLCDLEAEIQKDIDALIDKKREARKSIDLIDDLSLRCVLTLRYIECLTWDEIAIQLNYDYRHILRLHGKALQIIKDVTKCH